MSSSSRLLASAALLITGGACSPQPSGSDSAMADIRHTLATTPSIAGTITERVGDRVRVEEQPSEASGSAKALVRLTIETRILAPDGSALSADELREGRRVRVWFTGPVAESYPVQATAGTVVVER
ncbi:MAG TPA: DUF3221 domain-containing protein [Gemmatimonadaceae bacterium]|nr:DUF3221 domain-containing protein [Gemmatimonadaceae bacterium]